jgi:integrase
MTIEKLKSGKFRARIFKHGKRHSSEAFTTRKHAVMWETEYKSRALKQCLGLAQDSVSILEALGEFAKKFDRCTKRHQVDVLRVVASLIDEYGLKVVSDYKREHIESYIRNCKLSSCTLSRNVTSLKHFGKFLFENDYLSQDLISRIKKPTPKNLVEKRALSEVELSLLFKSIKAHLPAYFNISVLLASTGFRKMEAVTLEWENIDFVRKTISLYDKPHIAVYGGTFRCKSGSTRTIPLNNELSSFLQKIPRISSFIFVTKLGTMFKNNVSRDFKKAVMKSGIDRPKEVSLHSLRHTWITHSANNGLSIPTVAEYAGHKNTNTTQKYLHSVSTPEKMERD